RRRPSRQPSDRPWVHEEERGRRRHAERRRDGGQLPERCRRRQVDPDDPRGEHDEPHVHEEGRHADERRKRCALAELRHTDELPDLAGDVTAQAREEPDPGERGEPYGDVEVSEDASPDLDADEERGDEERDGRDEAERRDLPLEGEDLGAPVRHGAGEEEERRADEERRAQATKPVAHRARYAGSGASVCRRRSHHSTPPQYRRSPIHTAREIEKPIVRLRGSNRNSTTCSPAATGTARNVWFARRSGAGSPFTVTRQSG